MVTLKESFKAYFDYSEKEYDRIWKESIVVVDTNILLHFYRCSEETREAMYKMLQGYQERLWIPFQIAKEYVQNKKKVMIDSYKDYDKLESEISNHINKITESVKNRKDNYLKCKLSLLEEIKKFQEKTKGIITEEKENRNPNIKEKEIEKKILSLFDNKVGNEFSKEEYETLKKEGIRRQQNELPPGYMDKDKTENGDYYIFYSMMEKAKQDKKDIIFITDDVKEDWFNQIYGEKLGGRWELLDEFYKNSNQLLLIYSLQGFIKKNNSRSESNKMGEEALKELDYIRRKERKQNDNIISEEKTMLIKNMIKKYSESISHEERNKLFKRLSNITSEELSKAANDAINSLNHKQILYLSDSIMAEKSSSNYEKIATEYLINLFIEQLYKNKKTYEKIGSLK